MPGHRQQPEADLHRRTGDHQLADAGEERVREVDRFEPAPRDGQVGGREVAEPALRAGRTVVILSVGVLLENEHLIDLAREHGGQIIVPSGALLGLDAVTAAAEPVWLPTAPTWMSTETAYNGTGLDIGECGLEAYPEFTSVRP